MNRKDEQTLLSGVAVIQTSIKNIADDISNIKENGCPMGLKNNGKIKLNKQSIGFMKWILGIIIAGISGIAFFIIRQNLTGG